MPREVTGLIIGVATIVVFTLLIGVFAIRIGNEYGLDVSDLENSALNLADINETAKSLASNSTSWQQKFQDQTILGTIIFGLFDLLKVMSKILIAPFTLFTEMMIEVLYVLPELTYLITFIIITSALFGIWRFWRKQE